MAEENIRNLGAEVKDDEEKDNETEPRTYSQEEVDKLLQSEADKRVSEALKKADKKKAIEVAEAQKLARMNEEQRFQYELEEREKRIAEKEKEFSLLSNKSEASKILLQKKLSPDLVDLVVAENAEEMMNNINNLDRAFRQSIKDEVERRLQGSSPKSSSGKLTSETFKKLSMSEKQEIYNNNPTLYKELTNS